jgi:hypothetical protein
MDGCGIGEHTGHRQVRRLLDGRAAPGFFEPSGSGSSVTP